MPDPLDVFNCDLVGRHLVEASAGTGKTWNLCGLFLRLLLEDGIPIERILVVTFTHAATAELRDRIRNRIVQCQHALRAAREPTMHGSDPAPDAFTQGMFERLERQGIDQATQLQRFETALAQFDEASIFTIHGFCQRALADVPFSAGQALKLEVIQDHEPLIADVVADFWRERVLSPTAPPALLEQILRSRRSPSILETDLKKRLARPTAGLLWPASPDPETDGLAETLVGRFLQLKKIWHNRHDEFLAAIEADRPGLSGTVFGKDKARLQPAIDAWSTWLGQDDPLQPAPDTELIKALDRLTTRRYAVNKGHTATLCSQFRAMAQDVLDALAARQRQGEGAWLQLRRDAAEQLPGRLTSLKKSRQLQSFDDMLGNLHRQLASPSGGELARSLRTRFEAALIDEFQDTDPLQFEIFDRIFEGETARLFLLGDPKQAIYSFRNADLHTYLQARASVSQEHTLDQNQRSTPALIDALNHFFAANPGAFILPGVSYRPVDAGARKRSVLVDARRPEALQSSLRANDQPPPDQQATIAPALRLWELPGPDPAQMLTRRQAEMLCAQACAEEIASLLIGASQGRVTLDGRPLGGADIAVLVRTHQEGERIRTALLALGVASVSIAQDSVHHSPDALDLEQVLRAVLDPSHLGRIRVALSTDLMGELADTISALDDDDELLAQWTERFSLWHATWKRRGIGSLIRSMMRDLDVAGRWLLRTDGERRLTNVLHLIERLQEASREHDHPAALLAWMNRERTEGGASDAALLRLESDQDLVKVLTIHKSKGLEFPVVFCPYLWTSSARGSGRDFGAGAVYHDDAGRPVIDLRSSTERGADEATVKRAIQAESGAENARLVYVALTRAIHRVILICGQTLGGNRRQTLDKQAQAGTASLLNWMVVGSSMDFGQWIDDPCTPTQAHEAWHQWACAHPGPVSLQPIKVRSEPQRRSVALKAEPGEHTASVLPLPESIRSGWQLGSYSSLVHGADAERGLNDHDQLARAMLEAEARQQIAADDILHFPRSAQAGTCIHAVFERIHFNRSDGWPEVIESVLQDTPPDRTAGRNPETIMHWPAQLANLLRDTLSTRLASGFCLADIDSSHRLNELEFTMPATRLQVRSLQGILDRHGQRIALPAFDTLQGYLRGFIDLVFMHEDRYYILDWKSNHLGYSASDYNRERVAQAMAENHYDLQALLYCCALHRYLKTRLADYNHAQHFGGSIYLFVRGVRPQWCGPEGCARGVHTHCPSQALLDEIGGLLDPSTKPGHP